MTDTENTAMTTGTGPMKHADWMAAAELEYRRLLQLLAGLTPTDWVARTDCSEWDVRQVVAHVVGAAESTASLREARRQQKLGRALRPGVDGMNDVQVRERADDGPDKLQLDLSSAAGRGVLRRRRIPFPLRSVRVPFGPPLGVRSVGYLMDRIYTRDAWMHRIDISRATDRQFILSTGHDDRLVADVVDEWAAVHGESFDLTLTGPAGGHWVKGIGGQRLTLEGLQFCRILSGREIGTGLMTTAVQF